MLYDNCIFLSILEEYAKYTFGNNKGAIPVNNDTSFLLAFVLVPRGLLYAIVLYCGTVVYISEFYAMDQFFWGDLTTLSMFQDIERTSSKA